MITIIIIIKQIRRRKKGANRNKKKKKKGILPLSALPAGQQEATQQEIDTKSYHQDGNVNEEGIQSRRDQRLNVIRRGLTSKVNFGTEHVECV